MKTPTTASCFATYTLPHVLFVDDFEERQRIAMICCLAWNISLFPDARQREEHIEMGWNMSCFRYSELAQFGGLIWPTLAANGYPELGIAQKGETVGMESQGGTI